MDEEIWELYQILYSWDAPNIYGIYPLVNVYITMENHHEITVFLMGKSTISTGPCSIAILT